MEKSRAILPAVVLVMACNGQIGDARGTGSGPDGTGDGPGVTTPAECVDGSFTPAPRRLRRLTEIEYANLVRDLLGEDPGTARDFASRLEADEIVGGYPANGVAPVSEEQVRLYVDLAEELAGRAVESRVGGQLECDGADRACVERFVGSFGRRAFRRPLEAGEIADLMRTFDESLARWDETTALEHVLAILLASPQLLYRSEVGVPGPSPDTLVLTEWELASELSFFLWNTVPDDELLDAAGEGRLTGEDLEAEVRRMVDDPRVAETIESFTVGWLELGAPEDLTKDTEAYPDWSVDVARAARDETIAFTQHVLGPDGPGTFAALMTASYTYGDARVADLYGADAPDESGRIALDPAARAGILTQPAVLASHAYARDNSWVHRGKFVRERLFCQHLPSPPPDVESNLQNDPSRLTTPRCAACHQLMDPIGIGFEQYDAIGRFHPEIETSLEVVGAADVDLPETFDGPVDLAHALAESDTAHACFATQWYRYALRREETAADACALHEIVETWRAADWDVRELLVAIATSEVFRTRALTEAE